MKTIPLTITTEIPVERIQNLLCSAFEGGSNYWCEIKGYTYPYPKTRSDYTYPHLEVVLDGGSMTIGDVEGEMPDVMLVLDNIRKGLELFAKTHHYADFVAENDDAETADVFLQLCVFGEVIYG